MGNKKESGSMQLKRVAALTYNHLFHEDAEKLRRKYKITVMGNQGTDWFMKYSKAYKKSAYLLYALRYGLPFVKEWTKDMRHIADTDVPLEIDVIFLLERFRLPEYIFFSVLNYVISGDKIWLDCVFDLRPVARHTVETRRMIPELEVTIYGLNPFTTKEDWIRIWHSYVKFEVESIKQAYWKVQGQLPPARKRSQLAHYSEQMQRYAEWYRLSVLKGLGPSKAFNHWCKENTAWLEKYMKDHKGETLDESTFIRGYTDFQNIITPVQVKD